MARSSNDRFESEWVYQSYAHGGRPEECEEMFDYIFIIEDSSHSQKHEGRVGNHGKRADYCEQPFTAIVLGRDNYRGVISTAGLGEEQFSQLHMNVRQRKANVTIKILEVCQ